MSPKNGSEHQVAYSQAAIRDASGSVTGAVFVFRDVTERKRAEESLLASERRARVQRTALAQLALHPSFAESDTSRAFQVVAKSIAETLDVARASIWTLSEDGS